MHGDSTENKIYLVYELLYSIRLDFSKGSALKERRNLALKLCELAAKEYEARVKDIEKYPDLKHYWGTYEENVDKASKLRALEETIKGFEPGETDGRYFRYDFPDGYEGMLEYFGLEDKK